MFDSVTNFIRIIWSKVKFLHFYHAAILRTDWNSLDWLQNVKMKLSLGISTTSCRYIGSMEVRLHEFSTSATHGDKWSGSNPTKESHTLSKQLKLDVIWQLTFQFLLTVCYNMRTKRLIHNMNLYNKKSVRNCLMDTQNFKSKKLLYWYVQGWNIVLKSHIQKNTTRSSANDRIELARCW
jgi:hypothetical protein